MVVKIILLSVIQSFFCCGSFAWVHQWLVWNAFDVYAIQRAEVEVLTCTNYRYNKRESVAYAASRIPASYGATLRVFHEVGTGNCTDKLFQCRLLLILWSKVPGVFLIKWALKPLNMPIFCGRGQFTPSWRGTNNNNLTVIHVLWVSSSVYIQKYPQITTTILSEQISFKVVAPLEVSIHTLPPPTFQENKNIIFIRKYLHLWAKFLKLQINIHRHINF